MRRCIECLIRAAVACLTLATFGLAQFAAAAQPAVTMDSKTLDTRAKSLESEWRPSGKAAVAYFSGMRSLLREAPSLDQRTFAIASAALMKDVATVQNADRGALYKTQGDIAAWMLTVATANVDEATYAELRKQNADAALAYLKTLHARLREVATDQRPVLNVVPPVKTGGPTVPGMSPSQIKDPDARRAYEAAIAANEKLAGRVREQAILRGQINLLTTLAHSFMERSYARAPARDNERAGLEQQLSALPRQ